VRCSGNVRRCRAVVLLAKSGTYNRPIPDVRCTAKRLISFSLKRSNHTLAADARFMVMKLPYAMPLPCSSWRSSSESSTTLSLRATFHHVLKVIRNVSHHA